MSNRGNKIKEVYKVDWIGKDPNYVFSKVFDDKNVAVKLANSNPDALAYKLDKGTKDVFKWKVVKNHQGKELIRGAKLKRDLSKKGTFINADGESEISVTTVNEFGKSQKARALSMFVAAPIMVYAGSKKELPDWLRFSLIGLGAMTFLVNGRNYIKNRK